MKTIIITGASGSGKTILTNKLSDVFDSSIIINTDSYYSDNIIIKILAILRYDIYDRLISIRRNKLNKAISSINKKERLIELCHYDFKKKKSTKSKNSIKYNNDNQFLIIEGIFSHRLDLNYHETINILCVEEKGVCLKRRIKRDKLERGRNSIEVNKKFNMSWYLFYQHIKKFLTNHKIISLNPEDNVSFDNLVHYLKKK